MEVIKTLLYQLYYFGFNFAEDDQFVDEAKV